jgi:hypothetical protein
MVVAAGRSENRAFRYDHRATQPVGVWAGGF